LRLDGICRSDVTTRGATPHPGDVGVAGRSEPVAVNNAEDSCGRDGLMKCLEPLLFPDDDDDETEEGQFLGEVLSAVQRWFCCSGWPNSINVITVPDSLRRYAVNVIGSRPSDHYFRSVCLSVCLFVCLSVCLCRVFLSRLRSDLDQTRTRV